jgi:hypothetical protein
MKKRKSRITKSQPQSFFYSLFSAISFLLKTLAFLFLTLLILQPCSGQSVKRDTFYLDPVNGNKEASGKNPGQPAKSLPKFAWGKPGTTILYKRGIVVRGGIEVFSGTREAPVIIGAYGKGPKPIFQKSINLDSADNWVNEGNDIWRYTTRLIETPCANIVYNNEEYCGALRWRKGDLKKQGDWFMVDTLNGKFRFQDHLYIYSRGNPAKVYRAIEYIPSGNFQNFFKGDSNIIVQDLHIRNVGTHGIWFNGGHDITIRRCHLSYIGGAVYKDRIGINGVWVRYGNAIEIWDRGQNLIIEQSLIEEAYDAGFVAQGSCGSTCIDSVVIRHNVFHNNGFDNFDNSWGKSISRVYFDNNTCINAGDGWAYETEGRPRLSEFLPDAVGWHVFLDSYAIDSSTISIRNNIFYNATANTLLKVNKLPSNGNWAGVVLSNNCYFQKNLSDPIVEITGTTYHASDFSLYQKKTGKDQGSFVKEPLFVNLAKGDYRLKANSPCINAGTPTNGLMDYAGKPIRGIIDIGALEYAPDGISNE